MANSFFEKIQLQAFRAGIKPRTDESQDWFRDKLRNIRNINRQTLLRDSAVTRVTRPRMGDMYMFFYDPKHKETLPYYDTFPLIIMVVLHINLPFFRFPSLRQVSLYQILMLN